jgi:hypothetical protein
MEITLRKFDRELERYTRNRMRELRGETLTQWAEDPFIEAYTSRRIRELRLEHEMEQREIDLDNVALGGYTVATMEAYSGKS